MSRVNATSSQSRAALELVVSLQQRFLKALGGGFTPIEWLRDGGKRGGGVRFSCAETSLFNRASVNVSQVQYEDDEARPIRGATALSTIIHPAHPRAPSVHIHLSFTEPRTGPGVWRLMADLNPALPNAAQTARFTEAMSAAVPALAAQAQRDGAAYFNIPALGRTRGVSHFYVEGYQTGAFEHDVATARRFGEAAIDTYARLFHEQPTMLPTLNERLAQRAYHTAYFFQVLTLDRGTSSGLLAHDQNDLGVMGSLPAFIDVELLRSWAAKVPPPQDTLVRALADAAGGGHVTDEVRGKLAAIVRAHYRAHPDALKMQAVTPSEIPANAR